MFDGNYRSRRPVNLGTGGSSSRRRTNNKYQRPRGTGSTSLTPPSSGPTSNRDALLAESRRLREERQKNQERNRAACTVQSCVRGSLARRHLADTLSEKLELLQKTPPLQSLSERTTLLNVRLGLILFHKGSIRSYASQSELQDMEKLITEFASYLIDISNAVSSSSDLLQIAPLSHRIVRTVLFLLRTRNVRIQACDAVLQYCLGVSPSFPDKTFCWKQLGGMIGYTELLETLHGRLAHNSLPPNQQPVNLISILWQVAVAIVPATSQSGKAALAALALSQESGVQQEIGSLAFSNHVLLNSSSYQEWFSPLVSHLLSSGEGPTPLDPLATTVRSIEERSQLTILSNALALYNQIPDHPSPGVLLLYLERVLEMNSGLALLMCLFVRGEDLNHFLEQDSMDVDLTVGDGTGEEDDDSDDESDGGHVRLSAADSTTVRAASTGRLSKQELQTISKIDRTYQSEVSSWSRETLARTRSVNVGGVALKRMADMAKDLCDPSQWILWGNTLFSSHEHSEELWQAQESYVSLLATVLQATTGAKARQNASSPFLTKLAFHEDFLEKIWRYCLVQVTNTYPTRVTLTAFSVFSDIFSHRLIALKDEQFLTEHTTLKGPKIILAEHVIVHLKDLLYDLYWSRPVRAADVTVPFANDLTSEQRLEAVRGRLLLTGTKLWQSLYERWCRLLRQAPFCDESSWLFPHMTTLTSTNAVVSGDMSSDAMDLDSSDSDDEGHHAEPMSTIETETEALADAFSDPRMARILTSIPQALPFDRRVKLFHSLLANDKAITQDDASEMHQAMLMMMRGEEGGMPGRERVAIHRDRIYEDSMRQLNSLGPKLKRKVQVTFINQHGAQEAGIDGGGVLREFIDDLIKEAFSVEGTSSLRLFTVTPLQTLAVNSGLPQEPSLLSHYEFLGRVLGKAVYESILVEPQFCLPFLNQLLGKVNSLEDLKNYDTDFYRNLTKLLNLTSSEIESMGLTFELTLGEGSSTRTVELMRGGRNRSVTKENVIQYIHLVAHQRLNVETATQTKAFLRGFRDLIPASWVRLFSSYELQKLISGDDSIRGIDVASLKASMQYAAGYHPSQPVMQWFWEILDEMTAEQQRQFLKFMTSCSRQPLLGFSSLEPAPCVQQIRLPETLFEAGNDPSKTAPLPTSSTCMNLLKLPNYRSKELMRTKLLAAIESGAGFELS